VTYARGARLRFTLVFLLLLGLQFYVRPRLFDARVAPDFLMLGLILFAIRSRPGDAAILGFLIGLTSDALAPNRFGAGAVNLRRDHDRVSTRDHHLDRILR